ncbi:hypothetical protein J4G37_06035 [Microvirga sp. 3-52]|nr:hypothetical protein [Microvirga sp. 3-52]
MFHHPVAPLLLPSWPGLTRPSRPEERGAPQDRDHRDKPGDDVVGPRAGDERAGTVMTRWGRTLSWVTASPVIARPGVQPIWKPGVDRDSAVSSSVMSSAMPSKSGVER